MFASGASQNRDSMLSRGCAASWLYRLPSPADTPSVRLGAYSYPTFLPLALSRHVEKQRYAGDWTEERRKRSPRRERNVVIEFPLSVSANINKVRRWGLNGLGVSLTFGPLLSESEPIELLTALKGPHSL